MRLRSPLGWPQDSLLGRTLALDLFLDFSNHVGRSYAANGSARLDLMVHSLTPEDIADLKTTIERIADDSRKRSHSHVKVFPSEKLRRVTTSFAFDEYEAVFLKAVADT